MKNDLRNTYLALDPEVKKALLIHAIQTGENINVTANRAFRAELNLKAAKVATAPKVKPNKATKK